MLLAWLTLKKAIRLTIKKSTCSYKTLEVARRDETVAIIFS